MTRKQRENHSSYVFVKLCYRETGKNKAADLFSVFCLTYKAKTEHATQIRFQDGCQHKEFT